MQTELIQRHYDEVIARFYDLDPQSVIGDSLDKAIAQIVPRLPNNDGSPLKVLDLGMGTGRFLEKMRSRCRLAIQPFGVDLSEKMIDLALERIPDLTAVVGDAVNVDSHFQNEKFDLISTHFITGFVPLSALAPKVWDKLEDGGYWSVIGGTKAGFPALQRKADSKLVQRLLGGKTPAVDELVCNPADRGEVIAALDQEHFEVCECETFAPSVQFGDLHEFLEFAYWGGWLTPFVEKLGLHQAGLPVRLLLNTFVFPVKDHHSIEIILAQK